MQDVQQPLEHFFIRGSEESHAAADAVLKPSDVNSGTIGCLVAVRSYSSARYPTTSLSSLVTTQPARLAAHPPGSAHSVDNTPLAPSEESHDQNSLRVTAVCFGDNLARCAACRF